MKGITVSTFYLTLLYSLESSHAKSMHVAKEKNVSDRESGATVHIPTTMSIQFSNLLLLLAQTSPFSSTRPRSSTLSLHLAMSFDSIKKDTE